MVEMTISFHRWLLLHVGRRGENEFSSGFTEVLRDLTMHVLALASFTITNLHGLRFAFATFSPKYIRGDARTTGWLHAHDARALQTESLAGTGLKFLAVTWQSK